MSRKTLMHHLVNFVSRLVRGEICLSCARTWQGHSEICDSCIELLPGIRQPCVLCGLHNPASSEHPVCPSCLIDPPAWQAMFSPYHYSGLIRRFLLQAKFNGELAPIKGLCLGHIDWDANSQSLPEVLLPVPLYSQRLRQRGFNQAEEIARFWSARFDIPVDRHSLRRIKATESQSGLNARLRQRNVRSAFECKTISYRHVALVDDIITTGSTLTELTGLLHQQGVEFVEVWAVARACRKDRTGY